MNSNMKSHKIGEKNCMSQNIYFNKTKRLLKNYDKSFKLKPNQLYHKYV